MQAKAGSERLSNESKKIVAVIVIVSVYNSLSVVFHSYDVNGEEKLRYKLGVVIFFMMFLALYSIQIYVMIDGFVLYYKWRQLMIPSKKKI